MLVYIGTSNDKSGNPRRGWIVNYGDTLAYFVDEGYVGRHALREAGVTSAAEYLPMIVVTPSEYRTWKHRTRENMRIKETILARFAG